MRYLMILIAGAMLFGCKTPEQQYGTGQLVVNSRFATTIHKYYYVDRLQHLEIAIDRQGRNAGLRYCSSGGGNCFESTGINSLNDCNKSGKFDCGIFMVNSKVVWNGPMLSRQFRHGALMPFSGNWSFNFRWDREPYRATELQARLGKLSFPDSGEMAGCDLTLSQTGPAFGTFRLSCSGGSFVIGRFAAPPSMVVRGNGVDQDDRPFSFRLDLGAGRGAIYTADRTVAKAGRRWRSDPSSLNSPSSTSNPSAL